MRKKQRNSKTLIFFILFAIIINIAVISSNNSQNQNYNFNKDEKPSTPELAAPLTYSAITKNDTVVYRLFESVNFTVNASLFSDVDHVKMQISFSNGSTQIFNMIPIGGNNYSYEYNPGYKAPLNSQNVSFLIYDIDDQLLNNHTTYTNFTIKGNYMASFRNLNSAESSSEYRIGDTLYAELFISNFSSSGYDYDFEDWDLTVVDSDNEATQNNLLDLDSNVNQFTLLIDNTTFRQVNQIYYLKVNMTESNRGKIKAAYFPISIINSNPIFNSTIKFNPEDVFRSEECAISLNASDIETDPEDLIVTMYIYDSEGDLVLEAPIDHVINNSFSDTFTIPWHKPVGKYNVEITVRDENGGSTLKETILNVKNNLPEIHGYQINGKSKDQRISIQYGKNMVFTFNVSDTEGVAYIKIALLNENNEWYNITKAYDGINTEIKVRTVELLTGNWFVYLYVTDTDGAVVGLTDDYSFAPQGIVVLSDIISAYIPWITLFIGLGIGILIGIGGIYKRAKSKFSSSRGISSKKKPKPSKESSKKQKNKVKQIKEEQKEDEKDSEDIAPEKEEEKDELTPTRKIKRKL